MILISHRGNISGPNPERENHPEYIFEALQAGYDVDIQKAVIVMKDELEKAKEQILNVL